MAAEKKCPKPILLSPLPNNPLKFNAYHCFPLSIQEAVILFTKLG
jgi:hypothetical protein